ncbi:MAG: hypothetical protein SOV23_03620 [Eubacteriales bacterium]|nr:hypothetical protein [Christensenellaceae bacterium]MDY2751331.1 hypothetical protein [Eubacteriales bacterium]
MTINRKEKVLIFILILFLLVGGTYTLGIMPKNNEKETVQTELKTVNEDISKTKKQSSAVSNSQYNKLVDEIAQNESALKQLTNPSNNINEEVLPSNLPGHTDTLAIEKTLTNFFGEKGMNVVLKVGNPSETSGKKVYTVTSSYECERKVLYEVIDAVARVQSYNFVYLTIEDAGDGNVSGAFTITLTYILNDND